VCRVWYEAYFYILFRRNSVIKVSILSPRLYDIYINYFLTPAVYLALFADYTCMCVTDRKDAYVLRKLQRVLNLMESWCEHWNIKINEDKTYAICFSH
jgi:hypothetical protein